MSKATEQRFWSKVGKMSNAEDCWLWQGALRSDGYGAFWIDGRVESAHRVAYRLAYGQLPAKDEHGEPLYVCHRCDNPRCVNPSHLFLGTSAENQADRKRKGRSSWGERNPMAKITEQDALTIKLLRKKGKTLHQLARQFGLSSSQIHRIASGQHWSYLEVAANG